MVNWSNTHKYSQGWEHDEGFSYRGRGLQVVVRHDTSYPNQSTCVAKVWDPVNSQWNVIASVMWQEWAQDRFPVQADSGAACGTQGMWDAHAEVCARACAILDLN